MDLFYFPSDVSPQAPSDRVVASVRSFCSHLEAAGISTTDGLVAAAATFAAKAHRNQVRKDNAYEMFFFNFFILFSLKT